MPYFSLQYNNWMLRYATFCIGDITMATVLDKLLVFKVQAIYLTIYDIKMLFMPCDDTVNQTCVYICTLLPTPSEI